DPPGDAEDARAQDAVDPGARHEPGRPPAPDRSRRRRRGRARLPRARDDGPGAARRALKCPRTPDREPGRAGRGADAVLGRGAHGVQNSGIDGVNVTASVPDGMREVIAENLCVMLHDLESCTGNDTLMSASDIRRTAHTFPLLLAGTDFLFSGFGSIPAYDNAFGPSNMNAEDLDDYLVVQRDWGFEGGLRWREDAELLAVRRRAAEACRAVFEELGLAEFGDEDVDACVRAHGSLDVPLLPPDLPGLASERIMDGGLTALDAVRCLAERGFELEAERVLEMI